MRWNGKRIVRWCHRNPNIAKTLKEIVTGERCESVTVTLLQNQNSFYFFVYIFIHISANMSPFGLKFFTDDSSYRTSKLMYNWSFLFVVLHKPTLLPSTFNRPSKLEILEMSVRDANWSHSTFTWYNVPSPKCSGGGGGQHYKMSPSLHTNTHTPMHTTHTHTHTHTHSHNVNSQYSYTCGPTLCEVYLVLSNFLYKLMLWFGLVLFPYKSRFKNT